MNQLNFVIPFLLSFNKMFKDMKFNAYNYFFCYNYIYYLTLLKYLERICFKINYIKYQIRGKQAFSGRKPKKKSTQGQHITDLECLL